MVELRNADGHSRLSLATFFSNQKPSRPWYCRQQLPRAPIEMGFDRAKKRGALAPRLAPYLAPVNGLQVDESHWYDVLKRLENDTNQAS